MDFKDRYLELEQKFIEQVKRDRKCGVEKSSFVPNMEPSGPVDFVLIAMEPSTGVPGSAGPPSSGGSKRSMNFLWSAEDFIFHYCVRKYLCGNGQTYHLTDLSKGSMSVRDAGAERQRRYERWFPLLEEELNLVSKPDGTRIIAVGNVVRDFLKDKHLCDSMQSVLHYSRTAAAHRKKKAFALWSAKYAKNDEVKFYSHFDEFCEGLDGDELEATVRSILRKAKMDESVVSHRLRGPGNKARLTNSRKMLMFYYKLKFEELRHSENIVLRLP